jgi:hypothetical protein
VFTGIHSEEENSGSGQSTPGLGSSHRDKLQAQLEKTGAMYSRTMLRCELIEGLIRVAMLKYRESCPPPGASTPTHCCFLCCILSIPALAALFVSLVSSRRCGGMGGLAQTRSRCC